MTTPSYPPNDLPTLLIVEDELSSLTLFRTILRGCAYNILESQDWDMALSLLHSHRVDIILLDVVLPGIDGYEICARLKIQKEFKDIPIIFTSSLDQSFDEEKAFNAGAVDYVIKPTNPTILKARIATHLNIKLQREKLERQNLELAQKADDYKQEVVQRIQVENELQSAYTSLDDRVRARTQELRETNRLLAEEVGNRKRSERALQKNEANLTKQNARLEELSVALKVLLEKREQDQKEFQDRIVSQTQQLLEPYIEKLQHAGLHEGQLALLDILARNIEEIVSPFSRTMFAMELRLTPVEIQVANLVKQGKSSKEVAEVLRITPGTVDLHRKNIRKKCGLSHEKINLRTYLLSL